MSKRNAIMCIWLLVVTNMKKKRVKEKVRERIIENDRVRGGGKVTKMTTTEKVNDEQQEVSSINIKV